MYATPVLFPEQTNREDFLRTVSLFDDDTGLAIDVSGRTLALPGDFTGTHWTVTDGAIITNSVTSLTIKDYPFGNEMQAISLTVGLNLGILAGDPVTITDVNPLNSMTGYVTSYAPSTGALVCQIGLSFDLEIRAHHHHSDCDYIESPFGGDVGSGPIIQAQLGSGITVTGLGVVQVRVPASTINMLRHRTYNVGMIMTNGQDTRQIFVAKQPILYGGVSTAPFSTPTTNPFGLP